MYKLPSTTVLHVALLLSRLALGVYFFCAGFQKVRGEFENGFGSFYAGPFSNMKPEWLPSFFAMPYGYALPWIELTLGALLVLGLFGTIVAGLISLVLLSISIAQFAAGSLFAFQANANAPGPYHGNLIYLALAILLTITGPGRLSVDALWREKKPKPITA